ncbi:MAG: hypothetical protein EXQ94_03430 [Alphaproteobacteria bacterium]|nr:hypothetical protein [Alphaproteobacteria bacterium]
MTETIERLAGTLPNFFVPGAAKAGTTTLFDLLRQHPDIYLPKEKEPHFFDKDDSYCQGLGYYDATFYGNRALGKRARGDATPSYLHHAAFVAPRIAAAYGSRTPRFVVVLRDPVARAFSHFRHRQRNGREPGSFADALGKEGTRLAENPLGWAGLFRDGLYSRFLEPYWGLFGREAMLVVRFEELADRPEVIVRDVCRFLGVDDTAPISTGVTSNVASQPRSFWLRRMVERRAIWKDVVKPFLPARVRKRLKRRMRDANLRPAPRATIPLDVDRELRARYAEEFDRLETLLGWDLTSWREGPTRGPAG